MTRTRQLCTFFLDRQLFGIAVEQVQEVLRQQATTRVPLASPEIHGLLNLRGEIVTVIDLRSRLGLPARAAGPEPMNVVIRAADGAVSLLVDEIADVITVDEADFERRANTVRGAAREMITGTYTSGGRLLLELDTARVIDSASTAALAAGS